MNASLYLGRVFGIALRVHYLFLVLVAMFVFLGGPSATTLALVTFIGMLSVIVVLHELGHSVVAQHFGIRVLDITLWPLGGMARMSEIPENSRIEMLIAGAGPATNFALVGLAVPLYFLFGGSGAAMSSEWLPHPGLMLASMSGFLGTFIGMNLMLGIFNLVPAFPMDGGRVLRAALAKNGDWLGATETAVRVGRIAAIAMVFGGLFLRQCFLPLIGLFIWWVGARELLMVRLRHGRSPFAFGRSAAPWAPQGGYQDDLLADLFPKSFRPPSRGPRGRAPDPPEAAQDVGGYSDEDVENLERFRGRLPRPPEEP